MMHHDRTFQLVMIKSDLQFSLLDGFVIFPCFFAIPSTTNDVRVMVCRLDSKLE